MELALEVLLPPFVACLVLTGIHTYLGLHVVSRGVIFVDLALAQIAALGATFAFLVGYDPRGTGGYVYSLIFAFIGAAIFSVSRLKEQKVPQEAIIGISFAVASAMSILIADQAPQGSEFVEAMLTGALLWVPWSTIVKTAGIYSLVGLFHWYYRKRFLTISLQPEVAEAEGWSIRWWDFLFYTSFGFVITSSVSMAGVLLVFSFLVIPSVIGMMFGRSISQRLMIGWGLGTLVSMVGLTLSYQYDFPSGPAVVGTFGIALLVAAVVRYLINAEELVPAAARVAGVTAVAVFGLWLSFATASLPGGQHVEEAPAAAAPADPLERARAAVDALEASEGEPPADAVADLLAIGEELHRLMVTGQLQITEEVVDAVRRSDADGEIGDLYAEFAYHADDPWARLRGAEALLDRRNVLGVEPLIDILAGDHPPFLQLQAVEVLRQATGQDFGFDPQGDPAARQEAVERWRQWWEEHRAEPLPGSPGGGDSSGPEA